MPTRGITPAMAKQLLSMPGVTVGPSVRIDEPGQKRKKQKLVESSVALVAGTFVATIPVETKSEINMSKSQWKAASRRTGAAWKAVSKTIGPHLMLLGPFAAAYHRGKTLNLKFTRLGGARLDQMANLGTSMKFCEDAIAFMIGASDGDARWNAMARQSPGGDVGVMVEISVDWQVEVSVHREEVYRLIHDPDRTKRGTAGL